MGNGNILRAARIHRGRPGFAYLESVGGKLRAPRRAALILALAALSQAKWRISMQRVKAQANR